MADCIFWNVFAFPCIFAVLTVVPSRLDLALGPPSWLCIHFLYMWDSRSVNKGTRCQSLLLGCKYPSVNGSRGAVRGRKHSPTLFSLCTPNRKSCSILGRTRTLSVQILPGYLNSLDFCVSFSKMVINSNDYGKIKWDWAHVQISGCSKKVIFLLLSNKWTVLLKINAS